MNAILVQIKEVFNYLIKILAYGSCINIGKITEKHTIEIFNSSFFNLIKLDSYYIKRRSFNIRN